MSSFRRIVFAAICWLLGMLGALAAYAEASDGYYGSSLFGFAFGGIFIVLGSILFYEGVRLMDDPSAPFIRNGEDIDTRLELAGKAISDRYRSIPRALRLVQMVALITFFGLLFYTRDSSRSMLGAYGSLPLALIALEVLRLWNARRATPPSDTGSS